MCGIVTSNFIGFGYSRKVNLSQKIVPVRQLAEPLVYVPEI
jgi:hypothetical protein